MRDHRAIKHIWKLLKAERRAKRNELLWAELAVTQAQKTLEVFGSKKSARWLSRCKAACTRARNELAKIEATIVGYEALLDSIT